VDDKKWKFINILNKLSMFLNEGKINKEEYIELYDMIDEISQIKEHRDLRTISFAEGYQLGFSDAMKHHTK
jgi:hypothetical protein